MRKPTLKTWRRLFQLFIAVAFIVIPILNRSRYSYVYGNFLSFHMFGIPLADPLAVLQLTIKNLYPPTLDNFIGTFLPLLLAFFLGTVFCSWFCPYGFLSEITQVLRKSILGKKSKGLSITGKGFPLKITIFFLGLIAFLVFSTTPVLNQLSLPAWYTRFFQYYFGQDVISFCFLFIFGVLLLEFVTTKRLWCRYVCPQSVLIILAKQLNPSSLFVEFAQEKCICKPGHERCEAVCSLSLLPKTLQEATELECNNCGDCIVACKKMGKALSFSSPMPHWLSRLLKKISLPKKSVILLSILGIATVVSLVFLLGKIDLEQQSSVEKTVKEVSTLLDNKKISWQGARADFYEFLSDGTLICVGGEWPINGYKGGKWQQVDLSGSFKMIFDPAYPDSYTLVKVTSAFKVAEPVTLSRYENNKILKSIDQTRTLRTYETLAQTHLETATSYDATVVLNQYAQEVYVLDLRVQDPGGNIRKILTEGDAITTEVMLTNVKYWLNTPQITVSEGKAPDLPIKSRMEILFYDDHKEFAEFSTAKIFDRSDEEFDDPWF